MRTDFTPPPHPLLPAWYDCTAYGTHTGAHTWVVTPITVYPYTLLIAVPHLVIGARPDASQYSRSVQKFSVVGPNGPALHSGGGGLAAESEGWKGGHSDSGCLNKENLAREVQHSYWWCRTGLLGPGLQLYDSRGCGGGYGGVAGPGGGCGEG